MQLLNFGQLQIQEKCICCHVAVLEKATRRRISDAVST